MNHETLGRMRDVRPLGRTVDVAASCGLGRRDPEPALENMEQAAALCVPDG